MSQEIVKKKAAYPTELTEMQRRFCEYLIMNEGRTTRTEAAIHAGYSPKSATQEAAGLIQNPKIQRYLQSRSNEVNRAFTVTRNNYVRSCLLYTSPSPRDGLLSRMPSSA